MAFTFAARRRPRDRRLAARGRGGPGRGAARARRPARSTAASSLLPDRRRRRARVLGRHRGQVQPFAWIQPGWMGLDIGPQSAAAVRRSASPRRAPSSGTARWARSSSRRSPPARARSPRPSPPAPATPWSAAATRSRRVTQAGLADRIDHVSTGGGAEPRAARGPRPAGRGRDPTGGGPDGAHAARGRQLEDVQDARARRPTFCERARCRWSTSSTRSTSRSARRSRRSTSSPSASATPASASGARTSTTRRRARSRARSRAAMLIDAGATGVLLGHSERRALFGETDEALARKLRRGARGRARAGALHRRERGRARRRRDRARACARSSTAALAGLERVAGAAGHDRLRARLGDRHRPQRDARDRAGDARVHPRRARRALRRGVRGGRAHPLRRLGQARQRRARCSRSPTSTARSSAARASTRGPSRRSRARRSPADGRHRSRSSSSTASASRPTGPGNAVALARTPVFDALWERCPHTTLIAVRARASACPTGRWATPRSATSTSAPGASSPQDLVRIGDAVADGTLASNPALHGGLRGGARPAAACCTSPGSSPTAACTRTSTTCARSWRARSRRGVPRVAVHAFTDGRDVSPHQAAGLLGRLEREWAGTRRGDRDRRSAASTRWIATSAPSAPSCARAALVDGVGERADVGVGARSRRATRAGVTDEFVDAGRARRRRRCASQPGDPLVFFNFRPDRARQICHALLPTLGLLVTMTRYDDTLRRARRVRRRAAARHARRRARGGRPAPAARRRDREVRARDVLLRRRPRAAATPARTGSSCRRGATSRPTTTRPRWRPRASPRCFAERFARRLRVRASSTSRTPTWSGTRACCRP